MSREDPQMKIRLPADLKDQIETASKNSGRSMNAEIVARLEESFAPQKKSKDDTADLLAKLSLLYSRLTHVTSEITSLNQFIMQQRLDARYEGRTPDESELLSKEAELHHYQIQAHALREAISKAQEAAGYGEI